MHNALSNNGDEYEAILTTKENNFLIKLHCILRIQGIC